MSFLNCDLLGCIRSWLLHSGSPLCPDDLSLQLAGFSPVMMLRRTLDLISPNSGWTCVPCIGRWIFNHWLTREVPCCILETGFMAQLWQYSSAKSSLFRSPKEFWKSLPWASDIVTERLKVQNHPSVSVLPIPILEFCVCVLSKHFYFYALPLNFYVYFSASLLQFEYLG